MKLAILLVALALAVAAGGAAPAGASDRHPTPAELEGEVMCPTCHTTLDESSSPIAQRIKLFIRRRIAQGATKTEIENELVAQFGPSILAAPRKRGFDLLAWVLPFAGIGVGALVLAAAAWRWTKRREPARGGPPVDPELERRLDAELRAYDS